MAWNNSSLRFSAAWEMNNWAIYLSQRETFHDRKLFYDEIMAFVIQSRVREKGAFMTDSWFAHPVNTL